LPGVRQPGLAERRWPPHVTNRRREKRCTPGEKREGPVQSIPDKKELPHAPGRDYMCKGRGYVSDIIAPISPIAAKYNNTYVTGT